MRLVALSLLHGTRMQAAEKEVQMKLWQFAVTNMNPVEIYQNINIMRSNT